jgi:double zinc ribbon protein
MTLEVIAALLVGLAVLSLVLDPLLRRGPGPDPVAPDPEVFEETAKGTALSALREIEFDKATGKLSEDDYRALKAKYTAAALAVLRNEAPPAAAETPDRIEAMIEARVRALTSSGGSTCPRCGPRPETDALFCSNCGDRLPGTSLCPVCSSVVPAGARFCEGCGSAVAA